MVGKTFQIKRLTKARVQILNFEVQGFSVIAIDCTHYLIRVTLCKNNDWKESKGKQTWASVETTWVALCPTIIFPCDTYIR